MIGKVWTLIIVLSLIKFIHHIQAECMQQDIEEHLINELMEDHVFEIKVFSSETKESKLLTVINTLCSYMTKNNNKDKKFRVLETFEIMLKYLDNNITNFCATHTCMDASSVRYVNKRTFRDMYLHSCNSSVSDLKCPSDSTTPFTTISPNDTAFKNQTIVDSLTTSSSPKESIYEKVIAENQNLQTTIKTISVAFAVSLLLNVFLLLSHLWNRKRRGSQGTAEVNELSRLHSPLESTCLCDGPPSPSC
ncbi:uncharacterized protein isoform X2 [Danio rerio]|uniref:Uncharacterized protein isoform X2 n=3 Tax=Danio rerio TaxID=7955 RepID=A0AC58J2H4_DANRE